MIASFILSFCCLANDRLSELSTKEKQQLSAATQEREKAIELFKSGMPEQAIPYMRRFLAVVEDVLGKDWGSQAGNYSDLATLLEAVGQYDEAIKCRRECLRINEVGLKDGLPILSVVAENQNAIGLTLAKSGRPAEAKAMLLKSLDTAGKGYGIESPEFARFLNNLGHCYASMRDHRMAEKYYRQSLDLKKRINGCPLIALATTLNNLGELLTGIGRFDEARLLLDDALEQVIEAVGMNHSATAKTLNNIGFLLKLQANYPEAVDFYSRSLAIRRAILPPNHPDIGRTLSNRGSALLRQDKYKEAQEDLLKSLEILTEALNPTHPDIANVLSICGEYTFELGDLQQSLKLATRALNIRRSAFGDKNPIVGKSLFDLGVISMCSGSLERAASHFRASTTILQDSWGKQHIDLAQVHEGMGHLQAARRNPLDSLASFDACQRIIRNHSYRVLPGLSRSDRNSHSTALFRRFNSALSFAYEASSSPAISQQSAEWIVNNKAAVHEAFAKQTQLQFLSKDNAKAKRLVELRRELSRLAMTVAVNAEDGNRVVAQLQKQESELTRQLASERRLVRSEDTWIRLAAVQEHIPAESVLVEFSRVKPVSFDPDSLTYRAGPERYVAWVIGESPREVQITDLGLAQEIDELISAIRKQIDFDTRKDGTVYKEGHVKATVAVNKRLRQLAKKIYAPLSQETGDASELILCPDGNLWLAPWTALPINDDGELLIERASVRFITTSRDLIRSDNQFQGTLNQPMIFANPKYDLSPEAMRIVVDRLELNASPNLVGMRAKGQLKPVQSLPETEREARLVAPNLAAYTGTEPKIFVLSEALETLAKTVQNPEILLFSTHGFFFPDQDVSVEKGGFLRKANASAKGKVVDNPFLRCGLLFAGCNRQADQVYDDGILTGAEILGIDLRGTRLVVLSACETGVGKIRTGEGVAGLRQAFQLAGAQAVVASLWSVEEDETATLMDLFFENLAQGQPGALALRNAQLSRIQTRRIAYGAAHPYYWSAMTFTGN